MKKVSFSIILTLFIVLFSLNSCNKNDFKDTITTTEIHNNLTISKEVINSMSEFNTNFINNSDTTLINHTYGWYKDLCYAVYIAAADLIGAGGGIAAAKELIAAAGIATGGTGAAVLTLVCATVGGALASAQAHDYLYGINSMQVQDDSPIWINQIINDFPDTLLQKVGIYHNDYLKKVIYGNVSQSNWLNNIPNNNYINIEQSQQFINYLNTSKSIMSNYVDTQSSKNVIQQFYNQGYFSQNVKLVLINYLQVFFQIKNPSDLSDITNFYVSQIAFENNGLTKNDRETLYAAFSTGYNSLPFWINTLSK